VTRSTYKRLRAIQWIGGGACACVVILSWFAAIVPAVAFATFVFLGFPAAIAGWLLRDQNFEEMPY
jgi:hypothetical protein